MFQPPYIPNYEILSRLGVGGMSVVWKGKEISTGKIHAIKILNKEFTNSLEDIEQFKNEERTMERINHPGIVKSYTLRNFEDRWYFVMEYVDGYNFGQLLNRKQHLKEEDCLLICENVAAALDFAWNEHGIVHCDIKPENIMITSSGQIKLTDLGLSRTFRSLPRQALKISEHVLGTPAYVSPEQIFGDVELDCKADIYSLAATLYHLATGRVVFPKLNSEDSMRAHCDNTKQGRDPRFYRPELSLGFCRLLEKMLVKDRDCRIGDWQQVFADAQEVELTKNLPPRKFPEAPSSIKLL
jgi:serine/threonine-protein kinase